MTRSGQGNRKPTRAVFEPRIIGFLCEWCSYAAADLAGQSRCSVPPNLLIVKVPCTGRVDPSFILRAFAQGADGVLVSGCHPGDCHFLSGNYQAVGRIALLKRTLSDMGIDPRRLRLAWASASEGDRFAAIASEMVTAVRALGPLPTLRIAEVRPDQPGSV
jgi:coenzyme F420-reducing hydrogenase delta subunit